MSSASGAVTSAAMSAGRTDDTTALLALGCLGAIATALVVATPFAFRAGGDHAYMGFAIATGFVAMAATGVAERAPNTRTLCLIVAVAALLRAILLFAEPLLSDDIYRYVWDGRVQAAGINPYRYFPAHDALAPLRDAAIYPNINRADYAVTIYPPVAQIFFFLVTRLGESVTVMKLALLACEAGMVGILILLLQRIGRPVTRIVAYAWHPLPMWEIANNGHIDGLMVTLMMLGIWLALTGRPLRGAVSITLGALAKPFAVFALPALWRPWDWKMPLIVVAIGVACYIPYLSVGWGVFGFLTGGYLSEEHFDTGANIWPLAALRYLAGSHRWDFFAYLSVSALIVAALALHASHREPRSALTALTDTHWMLLVFLFLLSPNYPWYFLVLTPFVALVGGAPVWMLTLGALLLQEESPWDDHIPILIRKTMLYGAFLAACAYVAWQVWRRASPTGTPSDERSPAT